MTGQAGTKERSILYPDASPKLMSVTLIAPIAALLYLAAAGLQLLRVSRQHQQIDRGVFTLGLIALLCHTIVVWDSVFAQGGFNLGFYKISALIFLVINIACITSLARRPLQNLLLVLFKTLMPALGGGALGSILMPDVPALGVGAFARVNCLCCCCCAGLATLRWMTY